MSSQKEISTIIQREPAQTATLEIVPTRGPNTDKNKQFTRRQLGQRTCTEPSDIPLTHTYDPRVRASTAHYSTAPGNSLYLKGGGVKTRRKSMHEI